VLALAYVTNVACTCLPCIYVAVKVAKDSSNVLFVKNCNTHVEMRKIVLLINVNAIVVSIVAIRSA